MKNNVFVLKILAVMVLVLCVIPVTVYAADTVKPNAYIIGITSSVEKKVGDSIALTVEFKDAVELATTNFTKSTLTLNGFSANISISRTETTAKSHKYSVVLSNIQGNAGNDKSVTLAAGIATDKSGNTNISISSPKFTLQEVEVKDTVRPNVIIEGITSSLSITAGQSITLNVRFNDNVEMGTSNLTQSNVQLNGFTAGVSIERTSTTNKEHAYKVILSNIQGTAGNGKSVTIVAGVATDKAGNTSLSASTPSFTLKAAEVKDTVRPNVYITGITTATTVKPGDSLTLTVEFTDAVALSVSNFTMNKLVLNGFTANKSIQRIATTDKLHRYTVVLSNIQGTIGSNKSVTILEDTGIDASGNTTIEVSTPKFSIVSGDVVDTVKPNAYITGITSDTQVKWGENLVITVECTDAIALLSSDVSKNTLVLNGFTADITSTLISKTTKKHTYTVTLKNIQGELGGNKSVTLREGSAVDTSGNKTIEISTPKFTIINKVIPPPPISNPPTISIGNANPSAVYSGGKITYIVTFADDVGVTEINLKSSDITLYGFTADISVSGTGLRTRTVTLSNIKGTAGYGKYIVIAKGVAKDADGNVTKSATSPKFSILQIYIPIEITTVSSCGCIDDLKLLGDINKEITYFSSWLRAEKYTATYVQENNYVAENETMTYMVEYYNGSTAPAPDVSFRLTIPYYVDIEEINGCGYLVSRNEKETVIGWDIQKVPYGAYCRVFARVRFAEDKELKNSANISEIFYSTLKTIAGGNTSYSYMRQLYIDKTPGKTGTFTSYLSTLDATNTIRPDDEITRAEFAKLLADSGIVTVNNDSKSYKTFKDWEEIPVYARVAVSALVDADIVQAFSDGEFKPGNPILLEDAIQMVAQAAAYMSETKLTVVKPTFLYTDALLDRYNDLSEKKDYIMELMRQNVIVKYDCKTDSYALRKDIVTMVNALTFRGPYVETLPQDTMKFADIRDDSVYFYDFVGASNTYTYTYDYRLWQEITEINN